MRVIPQREPYSGKHWTFTPDGKQFFTLGLYHRDARDWELLDAYERHAKRRPAGVNVEFVYRDETSTGQKIIERQSLADILAYQAEMREIAEDAARQDEEARRKAASESGRPPWSR